MTIADLVKLEITKTIKELERLQKLLPNVKGDAIKKCPNCKTKNYHYDVKYDIWVCAYC